MLVEQYNDAAGSRDAANKWWALRTEYPAHFREGSSQSGSHFFGIEVP
jgi:hypothetical protein